MVSDLGGAPTPARSRSSRFGARRIIPNLGARADGCISCCWHHNGTTTKCLLPSDVVAVVVKRLLEDQPQPPASIRGSTCLQETTTKMSWLIFEGVDLEQNFSLNYGVVVAMPCLEGAIFTSNLNCRDHPTSTLIYALRLSIASEYRYISRCIRSRFLK